MKDEKIPILKKKVKIETDYKSITIITAILLLVVVLGGIKFGEWYSGWRKTHEWQVPIRWVGFIKEIEVPTIEEEKSEEEVVMEQGKIWAGKASWYGAKPEWCLGCNEDFIMANGEKLDDTKMTLAFNDLPLGTWVVVTNIANNRKEEVEITDTGNFDEYGKIADLSYALKQSLGCGDICNIVIENY